MLRNATKKILIWTVTIVSLVGACLLPSLTVYALTYTEAADHIHKASQIQRIFNVAIRCAGVSYGRGYSSQYDLSTPAGLFRDQDGISDWESDHTTMAAGPWLEQLVQGDEGGDGGIWCVNAQVQNIFEVLMQNTDLDYISEVACHYSNPNKPGILTIKANGTELTDHCQDLIGVDGYDLEWRSTDDAKAYMQELYNKYRQDNNSTFGKYLPAAEDIGSFTDSKVAYYVYLDDFFTNCADPNTTFTSVNGAPMPTDTYWDSVPIINPENGELKNVNYKKDVSRSSWDYSVVGSAGARSCTDIVKKLNDYAAAVSAEVKDKGDEAGEPAEPSDPGTDPAAPGTTDTDDSVTPECFNAASSLGWIICPVIKAVGEATSGIYNLIEENFLQTNSDSFASGSATYESWSKFRDFANIIFAILFIIVILSQVTGIGISNYGVKKALPRLIVVAVLVNLSFIACQVATDVSNILGDSLNSLFKNWANAVTIPADTFAGNIGDFASGLVSTLITGGIGVGAGYLAAISWEFWIWPLVLFLLTAVISILFFFLILGVRQAGVIILTVIAPIAIVCYALPNTKKFFDRWLKIYTALIFVYPICGVLMGGGEFASKILLANAQATDAGFIIQLVAMLISVVPFFFIPSLVRGSMAAMGNLGAKIAGMGDRLGRSSTGAIRRSDSFQDSQRRLGMRNALRSANRIKDGKDVQSRLARRLKGVGLVGAGNALDKSAQRSRNRAIDRYNRGAMEDIKARAGGEALEEGSARYEAMVSNMQDRQLEERADAFAQAYKDAGTDYDIDQMYNEHHNAVQALLADPTDRDARARLMATHKLLGGTDAGRAKLKESFYSTASQLQHNPASDPAVAARQNEGFKLAAQTLHRSHAGAIKGADRGFESFLLDASGGIEKVTGNGSSFDEGVITTERRADGSVAEMRGTIASKYDTAKISSYDASSIVKADEGALDRMLRAAQIPVDSTDPAKMSEDSRQQFIDMTTEALTNENVQVQPKIREKLNAIRTAIGAPAIAAPGASGDSIRINHNGGGSGSGTPTTGTPTSGNPTPGQGTPPSRAASAPIPDGATMTDSGIVIAPGNMSGEQIRRYAERLRDFNNGQNNNGQNNNNGGSGIILPH